ncbi:equilibrative nucleoside transporter 3 [Galendromus occidentalis]|uniref:Equilibrative nucleoside transporter 3 n=1 Tax=Galendromus occidentalis TaxID=34638 RepID=A0AAJ6QVI8_9ACAR|nr:equilibrative nucleoside transporter 3 [Galendromus occidentalis]
MEQPLPRDRNWVTLGTLFLLGVASLTPWNFFTTANDYWMFKLRNTSVPFAPDQERNEAQLFFAAYLSITSNVVFVAFLGLNALISKRVSSHTRIVYPLSITAALFVATTTLVEVNTDDWQIPFLILTLATVALLNVLVGFIMGASVGVCGYLPPRYMESCSLGQAVGGLVCCGIQIFCILLNFGYQDAAFIYFAAATLMLLLTVGAYFAMRRSDFFEHYRKLADNNDSFSFREQSVPFWDIFRRGWQFHTCSFTVFVVNISVFPAITANAVSTRASSGGRLAVELFIPLACFTVYNVADCIGRLLFNRFQISPSRKNLLLWLCALRFLLVPLLLFCNIAPKNRVLTPVLLGSDTAFIVLMSVLGASSGYLINAAFVFAPKTVDVELQEVSAGMVSWFSGAGSTVGSLLSYGLVRLL